MFLPRSLDISIATLAATIAMPTAWEHHYAWCIVLFCLCLAAARQASLSTGFLGIVTFSYLLIGTYIKPFESLSSGPASLFNSLGFAGGLLLLVAAWYACRQLCRHPVPQLANPPSAWPAVLHQTVTSENEPQRGPRLLTAETNNLPGRFHLRNNCWLRFRRLKDRRRLK
jgi:hypothetical protein